MSNQINYTTEIGTFAAPSASVEIKHQIESGGMRASITRWNRNHDDRSYDVAMVSGGGFVATLYAGTDDPKPYNLCAGVHGVTGVETTFDGEGKPREIVVKQTDGRSVRIDLFAEQATS